MSTLDFFELSEEQLKAFSRSAVRTKIMLILQEGEMVGSDLEEKMNIRLSTILHAMREMIDEGLVAKTARGYRLTNIGMIQALLLDQLVSAIAILEKYKGYWLTHDLSGIPTDLLARIGVLGQSEIISGDPAVLLRAQENFVNELSKSKKIRGVSPVIIPQYPGAIAKAVMNGADVHLILTKNVFDIAVKEYADAYRELLSNNSLTLYYIDEKVNVAFTVLDDSLSLGFFRLDGNYDLGSDIICRGEKTAKWGLDLFEYYLNRSHLVESI
ncbi:Methanogenesis regulatory protein FilR1 [uncultured archaeon]|nr:Methanogenesis regulatory protein FilR1 [uncultured archaeon]